MYGYVLCKERINFSSDIYVKIYRYIFQIYFPIYEIGSIFRLNRIHQLC